MCGDDVIDPSEFLNRLLGGDSLVTALVISTPMDAMIDYSAVDDNKVRNPDTRLKDLEGKDYATDPSTVIVESFNGLSYGQAWLNIDGADDEIAPGMAGEWADISSAVVSAVQNFRLDLAALEGKEDRWAGATHDAAMANLDASYKEPEMAGTGAGTMSILVDAFSRTIAATRANIVGNRENYLTDLANWPEHRDRIQHEYGTFAQKVMREAYAPNITAISQNNPVFTAGAEQQVDPSAAFGAPTGGPSAGGGGFGGGAGSFGRGGGGVPGFGGTSVGPPDFRGLTDLARKPTMPATPDVSKAPITGPTSPTGPAGIGNAAKDAASQAANAAKQAAGAAGSALKPPGGMPPEGVLGLGPKGLEAPLNKAGGAAGAGGGGAGPKGGAGVPRGMSPLASANSPLTAARGMAMPGAAVSGAGLGSGAGMPPPMPPPGGGQRGGGEEKDHKVLKALRRKQYGEAVVGENEAIVPVVGESEEPQPAGSERT